MNRSSRSGPNPSIFLHASAPAKPSAGTPCNGCGACCAAAPCPVSRWFLGHTSGQCPALRWNSVHVRYECDMVGRPSERLPWLPGFAEALAKRLFMRWIGAGIGCDFDADVEDESP